MSAYNIPMGSVNQKPQTGIQVVRAVDSFLYDDKNQRYLDLCSGLWNNSFGYANELSQQLEADFKQVLQTGVPFLDIHSYGHPLYTAYAEKLLDFCNDGKYDFERVTYTNSGSESTELAVKYVKHLRGNRKLISFATGYHGTFFAGMNVSGLDEIVTEDYHSKATECTFLQVPKSEAEEAAIFEYVRQNHHDIGGFFLEPVIGSGGVYPFSPTFLNTLLELLRKYDIISVFDEVATGFYRTGSRFYYHNLDSNPDLLLLSKAINNGAIPFGAVVMSHKVSRYLQNSDVHVEHFSTQNGNLLGVQSALTTLEYILENEELLQTQVNTIEKTILDLFSDGRTKIHGKGAMYSIEINDLAKVIRIWNELRENGILVYYYSAGQEQSGLTLFPILLTTQRTMEKSMKFIRQKL
ncbi:aminotransferase class III-fold pyridoxal phosphate-dependent enzyme [Listeria cornellensis]|uniref:Aminotransferase n=1 Tax=Listeria cornellensis FSL F6-0969 TaxID=1265820 RepID=W7BGY9_9LIST|nr:aminotransferase class III-fold pyridoxal phosphate-dependent enzyme [Listeria cornellensis]EUJ26324.1 aminotransferase [Listeria cornellensis FSL F6-0969]